VFPILALALEIWSELSNGFSDVGLVLAGENPGNRTKSDQHHHPLFSSSECDWRALEVVSVPF